MPLGHEQTRSESTSGGDGRWMWMPGRREAVDCHLLMRKAFTLAARPAAATLRVAASDQYRLFVNGRLVGDGPARSESPTAYYDTYELRELGLRPGANVVALLVHSTMMPQHGQSLCPGGVWVELECRLAAGKLVRVASDGSWRVTEARQFVKPAPRRFLAVGFNEKFDAAVEPRGWTSAGFDDSAWAAAELVDDKFFSRLVPRPVPRLRFQEWKPVKIRRAGFTGSQDGVWGLAFDKCTNRPRGGEAVFATYLHCARARRGILAFGCDNWARVSVNGRVAWEQGRPDAGFANHLEYDRENYRGMTHGNGHRYEPGSSRKSAVKSRTDVRLKRGWNRLTVWLWQPRAAYGFEGCFMDPKTGGPVAALCSALKDNVAPHTWVILPDESAAIERGRPVRMLVADMRPYLEPSHLADWDRQTQARKPHAGAASLLAAPRGKGPLVLPPGGFIELQLPADGVGFIRLELRGPPGALVDVTISEAQTAIKNGRIRSLYNGLWQTDRITLSGMWDRWLSLDRRAGRYLALCVRRSPGPVEVRRFALRTQHYPVETLGKFECSDWVFNRMWAAGAATVDAATFDVAEDCPTREKAQWGGDTYLRMFETAYLWGDVRLSAKAIREFAEDQKPDRWCRPMVPSGYGDKLVEYCLLLPPWVMFHYQFTGDMSVVRDSFQGVENLLGYAASLEDSRGFGQKGDDPRNVIYIDYTMPSVSRCGDTIGVMQCLYLMGLEAGAEQAMLLGRSRLAAKWRSRAAELRAAIRKFFWVEQEGLFVDGLRDGRPGGTFTAVTNYWMMLARVPAPGEERRILKRLWKSRTRENMKFWSRGESPYTKFFMSQALLERGLWPETFASWRGYYGSMLRHPEAMSVFEMWQRDWSHKKPVPRNSLVHPFAIGPMSHLMSHVAGVRPLRPGFDGILWEPTPGDLKWFKATVPLAGRGEVVEVEMKSSRRGDRLLVLRRPKGLQVQCSEKHVASGDRMTVEDRPTRAGRRHR